MLLFDEVLCDIFEWVNVSGFIDFLCSDNICEFDRYFEIMVEIWKVIKFMVKDFDFFYEKNRLRLVIIR